MFEVMLVAAALLCGLVAGLLFAFAVVAMPGIGELEDRHFIRAFQVMDRIIQNNQPIFMVVWVGSVVLLLLTVGVGLGQVEGTELALLIGAAVTYLFGVQLPTAIVNIPLNNRLQTVEAAEAEATDLRVERDAFEERWNRWNRIRTVLAIVTLLLLLLLLVTM